MNRIIGWFRLHTLVTVASIVVAGLAPVSEWVGGLSGHPVLAKTMAMAFFGMGCGLFAGIYLFPDPSVWKRACIRACVLLPVIWILWVASDVQVPSPVVLGQSFVGAWAIIVACWFSGAWHRWWDAWDVRLSLHGSR